MAVCATCARGTDDLPRSLENSWGSAVRDRVDSSVVPEWILLANGHEQAGLIDEDKYAERQPTPDPVDPSAFSDSCPRRNHCISRAPATFRRWIQPVFLRIRFGSAHQSWSRLINRGPPARPRLFKGHVQREQAVSEGCGQHS